MKCPECGYGCQITYSKTAKAKYPAILQCMRCSHAWCADEHGKVLKWDTPDIADIHSREGH